MLLVLHCIYVCRCHGDVIVQEEDGTFNFDIATVKNPVTSEKVRQSP